MKVHTKVQKWGNGLAIRIAGIMRDIPHFKEGTPIEVEVSEKGLVIKILKPSKKLVLPFNEADLLKGMTPKTAHADLVTKIIKGEY